MWCGRTRVLSKVLGSSQVSTFSFLSEQQLVDCDLVDSICNGVFVDNGFAFGEKNGLCTEVRPSYSCLVTKNTRKGDWGHNEWCHGNVRLGLPEGRGSDEGFHGE